jgi:two-component sensor histidine kinase
LVHENIYKTDDLSGIGLKEYLQDLLSQLVQTYESENKVVHASLNGPSVEVSLDNAIPLGLIVNELVTNAIKHGIEEGSEGDVTIELGEDTKTSRYSITIRDSGKGLPEGYDVASSNTLGMTLVSNLVDQLKGTFALESDRGTKATVQFAVD